MNIHINRLQSLTNIFSLYQKFFLIIFEALIQSLNVLFFSCLFFRLQFLFSFPLFHFLLEIKHPTFLPLFLYSSPVLNDISWFIFLCSFPRQYSCTRCSEPWTWTSTKVRFISPTKLRKEPRDPSLRMRQMRKESTPKRSKNFEGSSLKRKQR